MTFRIRSAGDSDAVQLEHIEAEADRMLIDAFDAVDWPAPDAGVERLSQPGFVLLGETDGVAAGFAHLLEVDAHTHLEQVSVLPRFGRRGLGRMLVHAVLREAGRRGHAAVTLRTYADVPWNGPFYASCGFEESEPDNAFLRQLVRTEKRLGLDRYGRRIQMTARLTSDDMFRSAR